MLVVGALSTAAFALGFTLPGVIHAEAPVPLDAALAAEVAASGDGELAAFYAARDRRPLWIDDGALRPEARELVRLLGEAGEDGLDPARYGVAGLHGAVDRAADGRPVDLARAEVLLSRALAAWAQDLHSPADGAGLIWVDAEARPPTVTARGVLQAAGAAPSLHVHLAEVRRMNPLYEDLRRSLSAYRARWSGLPAIDVSDGPALDPGDRGERVAALRRRLGLPAGDRYDAGVAEAVRAFQAAHGLDPTGSVGPLTLEALNAGPGRYERLILANLERARALPVDPGRRYILVDAAAARLQFYEDGRQVGAMRVVVGKPAQPTPAMAGRVRYAVFQPYWNVPEDLVRDTYAPQVLSRGPEVLEEKRLEALSDWSAQARVLDPSEIDWAAVADGRTPLRVRQRPGEGNMMGAVKFMLPNTLGVYLHDTSDRSLFAQEVRTLSAGCVRLEDAQALANWLFGGRPPTGDGPERRVDLPEPVPVYIVYLTAAPGADGVEFRRDVYGRDPGLLERLDGRTRQAAP